MAAQVRSVDGENTPRDPDRHHGASSSSVSPSAPAPSRSAPGSARSASSAAQPSCRPSTPSSPSRPRARRRGATPRERAHRPNRRRCSFHARYHAARRDAHAAGHPRRRLGRPPSERSQVRIVPSASPKRGRRRVARVGPISGRCGIPPVQDSPGARAWDRRRRPARGERAPRGLLGRNWARDEGHGDLGDVHGARELRRREPHAVPLALAVPPGRDDRVVRDADARAVPPARPRGCCARRSPACVRGRSTRSQFGGQGDRLRRFTYRGPSVRFRTRRPRRPCATPPARPCPSATSRAGARSSPTTSGPPCRSGASRPRWPSAGGPTPPRTTTPRTTGPTTPGARRASAAGCCGSTSTRRAAGRACRRPSRGSRARRGAATARPGACATGATPCASARTRWPATRRPGCSGRTPGAGPPTARSTSPRATSTRRSAPTCTTPGRRAEATRTPSTPGSTYGGWHTATTEWTPGPRALLPRPPARRRHDVARAEHADALGAADRDAAQRRRSARLGGRRRARRLGHRLPPLAGRARHRPSRPRRGPGPRRSRARAATRGRPGR